MDIVDKNYGNFLGWQQINHIDKGETCKSCKLPFVMHGSCYACGASLTLDMEVKEFKLEKGFFAVPITFTAESIAFAILDENQDWENDDYNIDMVLGYVPCGLKKVTMVDIYRFYDIDNMGDQLHAEIEEWAEDNRGMFKGFEYDN